MFRNIFYKFELINKNIVKNTKIHYNFLAILLFIFIPSGLFAQKPRVGIVFSADTTLMLEYRGLTIFTNKSVEQPFDFPMKKYIEEEIEKKLNDLYEVSFCPLPDSLKTEKTKYEIGKAICQWANTKTEYAYLVFIFNGTVPYIDKSARLIDNTHGIYHTGNSTYFYTGLRYELYNPTEKKQLKFDQWKYEWSLRTYRLKGIKLPKDKKTFAPEMLKYLDKEFREFLDNGINHFVYNSYLNPEKRIDPEVINTNILPPKIKVKYNKAEKFISQEEHERKMQKEKEKEEKKRLKEEQKRLHSNK